MEFAQHTKFAVIDTETCGLGQRAPMIEFASAMLSSEDETLHVYESMVRPPTAVKAGHIHGLESSDLKNVPGFHRIAADVLRVLHGCVLVAHNLRFDWSVLRREYGRMGMRLPLSPQGICTAAVARKALGSPADLGSVCTRFGIETGDRHTAMGDVQATAQLFRRLVRDFPQHLPRFRAFVTPTGAHRLPAAAAPVGRRTSSSRNEASEVR